MNPIKLAIVWCVYMAVFLALAESLDAYKAHDWILEKLSISKEDTKWTVLKSVSLLSLLLTSILIWITAKHACNFIGGSQWQRGRRTIKRIKLIVMWIVFLVPFSVIVFLLLLVLPEAWLHRLITGHEGMSCDDVVWQGIYMGITLALALPINGAFVAFVTSKVIKRKQLRQSAQQKTTDQTADP